MIFKRYGTSYHSVETDFDSKALNEISFRRDRNESITVEEMESDWTRVEIQELQATHEGKVQDEAEQELLDKLLADVEALVDGLGEGEIVVVESEQGKDWPKTRHVQKNVIVEGENRLYFHNRVEPPLRLGVYRKGD